MLDITFVNKTAVHGSKEQQLLLALLSFVPYGETIDKVTVTQDDGGYRISIRTQRNEQARE